VASVFKWGKPAESASADDSAGDAADERRVRSRVLPRFLQAVAKQSSPVLVDLGPVVGSNIQFFGERLSCKIHVEDLCAEVEACAKRGDRASVASALISRLRHEPESADGILCWDVFDFLDRAASKALAAHLVGLLRPGGALLGSFTTEKSDHRSYTRFRVETENTLCVRSYAATPAKTDVLTTREVHQIFSGLTETELVLLKSGSREMLFRKT
jgi:hypothetical protein